MRSIIVCVAVLLLAACGREETTETAEAQEPEPVAPVEVNTDDDETEEADDAELTRLRTRVSELEQQLAQCRSNPPVPAGVDPPSENRPAQPTTTTTTTTTQNQPDAGRRRRRTQDTTVLDPARLILGR